MKFNISGQKGNSINANMIGVFFEDISYAADGGLYAEMIENRSFEAKEAFGTPGRFYAVDDPGYAWSPYAGPGNEKPQLLFVTGTPLSEVNPHYLKLTTTQKGQGFSNQAYDGIRLEKGRKYSVRFYARNVDMSETAITVKIEKNGRVYASGSVTIQHTVTFAPLNDLAIHFHTEMSNVDNIDYYGLDFGENGCRRASVWNRFDLELTAEDNVRNASFVITVDAVGVMDFDFVSMIPEDAVAGVFRPDLFHALKDLHPGFVRFPGGCIVEGLSVSNRYRWKRTVGPVEGRTYQPNLWAFDDDRSHARDAQRPVNTHYGQTAGLGFYEFFLLCEMIGAKPLPILSVGVACQFRSTEAIPVDSPEFDMLVQDAVDLVEFANGAADSKWGSVRASMGHPEPFNLEYIGIGNEQWETRFVDFFERHRRFEKAIHDKYPDIKLIGSAGPSVRDPVSEQAWDFYREGNKAKPGFIHAVDEHYYVSPEWMYRNIDYYDDYPRDVYAFSGEYAAHTKGQDNVMEAALAEASYMTGLEKNADVVRYAAYAPLLNRINHSEWSPNLIWFDDERVYLTPSYQVQKMYANNLGSETVPMNGQETAFRRDGIYLSLSRKGNEIILKAVNSREAPFTLELAKENGDTFRAEADRQTLRSDGAFVKGMPEPTRVDQDTIQMDGAVLLEAGTFTILRFPDPNL